MLIHASHQPEARRAIRGVGLSLLVLVVMLFIPGFLASGVANGLALLLLLLTLSTLAIGLAGLVFAVVWSVRGERLMGNMVLIACAFLGVALLEFSHRLLSQSMSASNEAISTGPILYFWLGARLLGALGLLVAACLPWRRKPRRRLFAYALVLVLVFVGASFAAALAGLLPAIGVGIEHVHGFKQVVEYVLVVVCLLAAVRFAWHVRKPRRFNASGLFAAAFILAESAFISTTYSMPFATGILVAEVYKVMALMYLFQAVFVETVRHPYALLRDSQQQLSTTLDALPDLMLELDGDGNYVDVHSSSPDDLADQRSQLLGKNLREVLTPEGCEACFAAMHEARQSGVSRGKVIDLYTVSGKRAWFELSVARKPVASGMSERFVCISRNITQRRLAEQELRKLSSAVEQSPVAIVVTDPQARLEYVNAAFTRATGYALVEVDGRNVHELLHADKTPAATVKDMWEHISRGEMWRGEMVNRSKHGDERDVSVLIYPVRDGQDEITHFLVHQQDITAEKRAAARIQELSRFDRLTGLPNRDMLQEYFQHTQGRGEDQALLWIDLDRFKDINDSLGHEAGDLLLVEISRRLHLSLRTQDMASRHSGDEFVVLLPDTTQEGVAELARRLLSDLSQPVQLGEKQVFVTISIGIALYPDDADQLDGLLKNAEIAVYRAKDNGRNEYCFFTAAMQERTTRLVEMGNALKQAVSRGELRLVYQPQIELRDNRVVGVEALLRWDSALFGSVPPDEFIPVAEANGSIKPIGEWVLREALRQWRGWVDRGLPPMMMAVNLSAVQFDQADLAGLVSALLHETGVPAQYLELELTEATAMKAPDLAVQRMEELGRQHVRLAIDDFGTGYSSLSYLKQFKINKLKIDQSFVRDINTDPDDQAIASAIVQMARSLGITTIAEGVETAEQLAFLREHGCEQIQGYLISHPLPPEQLEQFVRARA